MGRACRTYGEKRNVYRVLVRNPEGKRPLHKSKRRWEGKYCNRFDQCNARQRLRKQGPTRNNNKKKKGLWNPLLRNSPLNTFQHICHATMDVAVFSMRRRHTTIEEGVFTMR
jgi:hypothetical protein